MALAIGALTQVLVTPSSASLLAVAPTGGVAPYSYQWYRSSLPNFTPSSANLLTGQTALSIIDSTLQPNTIYYYAVVATDSTPVTPLTVTTAILGICSATQGQSQYQDPSVTDFMNFFFRDFPYDTTNSGNFNLYILQQDILKAFQQANAQINARLYLTQTSYTTGNLWLSAHRLCTNINNSSQGINGQFNWGENSKSVGPISQSFSIPEGIINNPYLFSFTKTTYGADYVLDLYPRLTGGMSSAEGYTKP